MDSHTKNILTAVFYGIPPITSIKVLYDKVKEYGITNKQVKDFVQSQEITQMYKPQKRIKYFFPIVAKEVNEIWQIDLMDISKYAKENKNFNFFLVGVDVFSRFAVAVPMKEKTTPNIITAFKEMCHVMSGKPKILNCDNGSEFISTPFKKLMKENNIEIRYVPKGDHHKLSVVDRWIRTFREKLSKFMDIHNTLKFIDDFKYIVDEYNDTYHSTIKKAPREVDDKDKSIIELTNRKYNKAIKDEIKFNIFDKVRYIKNRTAFEKGSTSKWSKTIHSIVSKTEHTYALYNKYIYKYYELQLVKSSEAPLFVNKGRTIQQLEKENKQGRILRREGVNIEAPKEVKGKRNIKRPEKFKDYTF